MTALTDTAPIETRAKHNRVGTFAREEPITRYNKKGRPMAGYSKTLVMQPLLYQRLLTEARRKNINTSSLMRMILSEQLPELDPE